MKSKVLRLLCGLVLLYWVPWHSAQAQTWPNKEKLFRVVCPFPVGQGADIITRYFADKLATVSGQTAIVENRVGQMGAIAANAVARSKPDGYTIFISPASGTHAMNASLFKELPYDPIKDFTPVTTLAKTFFVLAVDPGSPYNSVRDLTEALKKKGDKAAYAYISPTANVASALYKQRTGIQALGVPFTANVQTLSEMRSGQIDFQFLDGTSALGLIAAGRLRALAVTTPQRSALMPDTPTMTEAGVSEYDVSPWWAVFLPANAPQPVVDKLEGWFNQIVAMEDTKTFLAKLSADTFPGNAAFLSEFLRKEIKRWGELIKLANIEPQ